MPRCDNLESGWCRAAGGAGAAAVRVEGAALPPADRSATRQLRERLTRLGFRPVVVEAVAAS